MQDRRKQVRTEMETKEEGQVGCTTGKMQDHMRDEEVDASRKDG